MAFLSQGKYMMALNSFLNFNAISGSHAASWEYLANPRTPKNVKFTRLQDRIRLGLPLFKQSFASNLLWMVAKSKSPVENGGLYVYPITERVSTIPNWWCRILLPGCDTFQLGTWEFCPKTARVFTKSTVASHVNHQIPQNPIIILWQTPYDWNILMTNHLIYKPL